MLPGFVPTACYRWAVYIGRSKTLAQRIGTDLRALQETQATLTYKLMNSKLPEISNMSEARDYMYNNYTVKMLPLDSEHTRAIFQVFVSMKYRTEFNSFMEH